ncbi:MAG TPA: glycosyltransferase family 2 protein [Chloroflexota bacterium]|nr:glycosyltransferase family 2 protein [Chloroflexota bacterium]
MASAICICTAECLLDTVGREVNRVLISVCLASVRATTLGSAIRAVRSQTWDNWELIVVGQGDEPVLCRAVTEAAAGDKRVRYIHSPRRGLSVARNLGIEASNGEVIAMTDDDCEPDPEWLGTIAGCFTSDNTIGVVGGSLLAPMTGPLVTCPSLEPTEALYDPAATARVPPAGWDWIGGNFAIRRGVADHVGHFDECLGAGTPFPCGEDTDYKLRLEAVGVRMYTTPRSVVHHTWGVRRGVRAGLRHSQNYARGNGALAAKLTLLGDPRGEEWRRDATREASRDWSRRPYRLAVSVRRVLHFRRAYAEVLRHYELDSSGLLRRRA